MNAHPIKQLLRDAAEKLRSDDGRAEAEILLAHVLGRDRAFLYAHAELVPNATECARYAQLIDARAAGHPVAYLTGVREFWSLHLQVTPDVLIPRAETELLVELALARIERGPTQVADLGTGSGAIALALAKERPLARVVATDVSAAALSVARGNAIANSIANVEFRIGSWFGAFAGEQFALIASNPPYVANKDPHLAQGDLRHEPACALASGADGLDAIRIIVSGAGAHLLRGGWLMLEHGWDQGAAARSLLIAAGFAEVFTAPDLGGRDRVSGGRYAL